MSELKQKAEEELMGRITVHELAKLTTGATEISVIDRTLQKDVLTKALKDGWILKEDLDENYDTIVQWERVKDFINTTRREIRELEEGVVSMIEQIANVESGKWSAHGPMLPRYKENLEKWQKSLVTEKRQLEEAKIEFKPLKASIKSLKDKFKLYISKLEVVE